MSGRTNGWTNGRKLFLALLLLAAAACGKNRPGDSAEASGQETDAAVELGGPENAPSVADHTFKSYYAWRYYAADGTFEDSDVYGNMRTGRWWMKDGEVCAQFDMPRANPLCSKPDFAKLTPGRVPEINP